MTDGDAYFAFELARELGHLDPDVMLTQMPNKTFTKWKAFYRAESKLRERAEEQAKLKAGR